MNMVDTLKFLNRFDMIIHSNIRNRSLSPPYPQPFLTTKSAADCRPLRSPCFCAERRESIILWASEPFEFSNVWAIELITSGPTKRFSNGISLPSFMTSPIHTILSGMNGYIPIYINNRQLPMSTVRVCLDHHTRVFSALAPFLRSSSPIGPNRVFPNAWVAIAPVLAPSIWNNCSDGNELGLNRHPKFTSLGVMSYN